MKIIGILAALVLGVLLGCLGTLIMTDHFWWRSYKNSKFTSDGVAGQA